MITIILTFFAVFIAIIQVCFQQLLPITLPILFLWLIFFITKIRKQCKIYGTRNVFRFSHQGKPVAMDDYVYMMLQQNTDFHIIKKWEDKILFLNQSGIYLFKCFYGKGNIIGNAKDTKLICRFHQKETEIINPIPTFQKQINILQKELNCTIKVYFVIENQSQFLVEESNIKPILLKNVYTHILKQHEQKYDKQQLSTYSRKIDKWLSNNVNNSVMA